MAWAKTVLLKTYKHTTRVFAMLRAVWRARTPNRENSPPLLTLPVEILHLIRDLLPLSSAVCFTITSRHLLGTLGSETLHSLRESSHDSEKKSFLTALERDLPDWQLCHPCSLFHPVDPRNGPKTFWLLWSNGVNIPDCVDRSGAIYFDTWFHVRYEHVQLVMNRYRYGLPYSSHLKRLCHHYKRHYGDLCLGPSHVESTFTASIENGALVMLVTSRLQCLNGWDSTLIDICLPQVCPHRLFSYSMLSKAIFCCRSHGDGPPCAKCSKWYHCKRCSTRFSVKMQDLETTIEVKVRKWLGSCKDCFDPEWRNHCFFY